jgi:hypothetical protein
VTMANVGTERDAAAGVGLACGDALGSDDALGSADGLEGALLGTGGSLAADEGPDVALQDARTAAATRAIARKEPGDRPRAISPNGSGPNQAKGLAGAVRILSADICDL